MDETFGAPAAVGGPVGPEDKIEPCHPTIVIQPDDMVVREDFPAPEHLKEFKTLYAIIAHLIASGEVIPNPRRRALDPRQPPAAAVPAAAAPELTSWTASSTSTLLTTVSCHSPSRRMGTRTSSSTGCATRPRPWRPRPRARLGCSATCAPSAAAMRGSRTTPSSTRTTTPSTTSSPPTGRAPPRTSGGPSRWRSSGMRAW